MRIEVDIPEKTVTEIIRRATKSPSLIGRQFVVNNEDRQALEAVFQTTIKDAADLVQKVRGLSVIKIGTVEHLFAPDELQRIEQQAVFHGRTTEVFLREMVNELAARMLEQV